MVTEFTHDVDKFQIRTLWKLHIGNPSSKTDGQQTVGNSELQIKISFPAPLQALQMLPCSPDPSET